MHLFAIDFSLHPISLKIWKFMTLGFSSLQIRQTMMMMSTFQLGSAPVRSPLVPVLQTSRACQSYQIYFQGGHVGVC